MATVERSVDVDADPSTVWAVLADYAAIATWASNVDHSCLLSEQLEGVGAVRRIQSGRTTVVETVGQWEPGVSLGYSITGLPPVIKSVTNTWALTPLPGGTHVTLTTDVEAGARPPQRGIAKLVSGRLAQTSDEMLEGLRDHLSAQADRSADARDVAS